MLEIIITFLDDLNDFVFDTSIIMRILYLSLFWAGVWFLFRIIPLGIILLVVFVDVIYCFFN